MKKKKKVLDNLRRSAKIEALAYYEISDYSKEVNSRNNYDRYRNESEENKYKNS